MMILGIFNRLKYYATTSSWSDKIGAPHIRKIALIVDEYSLSGL